MAFRTTPQLGPQLNDAYAGLPYWDGALGISNEATDTEPSYRLGNKETGNDGHEYVFVQAGAVLSPGDDVIIDESTWVATAGGSDGLWEVPDDIGGDVPNGGYFHARRSSEGYEGNA